MALYTLLNNVSANTTGSSLDCRSGKTAVILVSGSFNADVKFQASLDGTNWFPYVGCVNGSISSGEVRAPSYIEFDVEGIAYLQPLVANYVTGNITVTGYVEARPLGGNNTLIGNYSASFVSGAAANTSVTITVPLPANPQPNALYGIGIVNPSALGTEITVTLQNLCQMANGSNYYMNVLTNYQVNSGTNAFFVVQGFLLGDGAGQITVTVTNTTSAAGTVYIQVREV